jgi:protein-disulfide isomerase
MRQRALDTAINALLLGGLLFFIVQPDGMVRTKYRAFQESRQTRLAASQNWDELVSSPERIGNREATNLVVVYADYQCSFCRIAHERLKLILEEYPEAAVVYRHFPLTNNPHSEAAARASICAQEQRRFVALNAFLYETSDWQEGPDWTEIAEEIGIPESQEFLNCLSSEAATERLREDRRLADLLNVNSTPTFVSAGGVSKGLPPEKDLLSMFGIRP